MHLLNCSALLVALLTLTPFVKSFVQSKTNFGSVLTEQDLFQHQDTLYRDMANVPGEINQLAWTEESTDEIAREGLILVVDRILEQQTIPHFLEFAMSGKLPGNKTTALPLLSEGDVDKAMTPYSEWAPPPYMGLPKSALERVMTRIGSVEDGDRLQVVEKNIQAMKSRLWEGILPLSNTRWRQKQLDDPENFSQACQHLSAVVEAFSYLNMPETQSNLRETFNLIAKELKDFEDALNAWRSGQGRDRINVAMLWAEYIRASFQVMATRAHSWVINHVNELRGPILDEVLAYQPPSYETYSPEQWRLTNMLHDLTELAARADYSIMIPLNGYTGCTALDDGTDGTSPDLEKRKAYYGSTMKLNSRIRVMRKQMQRSNDPLSQSLGIADPNDIVETYNAQTETQDALREQIRKDFTIPLAAEQWIMDLKGHMDAPEHAVTEWGFVIYRLTYSQTEEEWEEFMKKLNADVDNWGEGVIGADIVRESAKLHWMDGREFGIGEGDFDAAKRHFLSWQGRKNDGYISGIKEDIFLVVDSLSFSSYAMQLVSGDIKPAGDFGGFVTAVEANFDPNDPGDHAEESPGFTGRMGILGSLIWSDLYALAMAQTAYPEDLWPLAMNHPWHVYVGPTVPVQRQVWKEALEMQGEAVRQIVGLVK